MHRTGIAIPVLIIPTASLFAVALLSFTPWGTIYQTLRGYGKEEHSAIVHIAGISTPKVDLAVATYQDGAWIRMMIRGKETKETGDVKSRGDHVPLRETRESKEVFLAVPASWELQEVRGVHIRDIAFRNQTSDIRELVIPYSLFTTNYQLPLEFVFTTSKPFDTIVFSHDSSSFTLLTFTHVQWPEKEVHRTTTIIQGRSTFSLF